MQSASSLAPRPMYEMEQVLPGADPDDWDGDPITESNDRKDAGDVDGARHILCRLLEADLRCLDAHAHLANMVLERALDRMLWLNPSDNKLCATSFRRCRAAKTGGQIESEMFLPLAVH